MEVATLIDEADRYLREADPLCGDANAFYAESRLLIEQSTVLWARILFLRTSQRDQLQCLGNICLVIKNGVDRAHSECSQKVKTMRHAQASLRELLAMLRKTRVDDAFSAKMLEGALKTAPPHGKPSSKPASTSRDKKSTSRDNSLHQYVHKDDIARLEARVDELGDLLMKKLDEIEGLPQKVQNQLSDLRQRGPDTENGAMRSVPRKLARISQKAAPYASQMASLLMALTSHYDLCSQLPQLSPRDADEASRVASADRTQVMEAVAELKEARAQLKTRHRESQRIQHSLDMAFEQCKKYDDDLASYLTNSLKVALYKVQTTHHECAELMVDVDALTAELTGLTEYYRLFKKSYHALVVEIARRHESRKQLTKVMENANNALRGFQQRESTARQAFVQTYQEFLPAELWMGMDEPPREYAVRLEPELLPELSESTMVAALREHTA